MKRLLILLAGLLCAQPSSADVFNFETPSQNVQCNVGIGDGFADISCTIINRQGPTALPRPANCKSDWGHKFEMNDRGPVKMVCSPLDSSKGAQSVAEYGVTGKFGGFKCLSSKKGFECLNRDKNGFFLSRKKQLIFNSNSSSNAQSAKSSSKDQDCLNTSIRGKEYPFARNRLMKNGWKPKFFSPPFEMAPFADWVQKRNYAEVEACSGTGQALCKFVYESETDKNSLLSVFTAGEDLGIVTGHQCVSAKDMLPEILPQLSNSTSQNSTDTVPTITVKKAWSRDPWDLFYAATLLDYDQLFELRVNCVSNKNTNDYNSIYLFFGQDDYSGIATFKFNRDEVYQLKFVDSYSTVDTPEKAAMFEAITAKLKSNNSLSVISFDGNLAKVSLKGSSKAIGECPVRNVIKKTTKSKVSVDPVKIEKIVIQKHLAALNKADANSRNKSADQTITNTDEPKLTRTVSNGIVHHKLDKCDNERGVAIAHYNFRETEKLPALEMSDICFARKNTKLWASESDENLVLVRKADSTEFYEVISPNTASFERWSATAGRYYDENSKWRSGSVNFSYQRSSSARFNYKVTGTQQNGDVAMYGFLYENSSTLADVNKEYSIHITALDHWDYVRDQFNSRIAGENPYLAFSGMMKIEGSKGKVELNDTGEGDGEGGGALVFNIDEMGRVSGEGTLNLSNARLAGLNDHDWKNTELRIEKIVGQFVGKNGSEFRAVGIATGETTDQDGYVNKVKARLTIMGSDSNLENEIYKLQNTKVKTDSDSSKNLTIEKNLNALGFNSGIADGVFDDDTARAIEAFQKKYGLNMNSNLSDEQLIVLDAMVNARKVQ